METSDVSLLQGVSWNNDSNSEFYERLSIEDFKRLNQASGLNDGCDVEVISDLVIQSNNILELGAGYGRVIDKVRVLNPDAKLTAIERSDQYYDFLTRRYEKTDKLTLMNEDIKCLSKVGFKFDLILMMWTFIDEFNIYEQKQLLEGAYDILELGGSVVIDVIEHSRLPDDVMQKASGEVIFDINGTKITCRNPMKFELNINALLLGYKDFIIRPYFTSTEKSKLIYILKK